MSKCDEIIDLTDSIVYDDHCAIIDVQIVLDSDDSYISPPASTKRSKNSRHESHKRTSSTTVKPGYDRRSKFKKWGDCPVCLDELGKNPLASTKCGHVFCLKCLENSLHTQKKCPTCRLVLHGKSAYHPLYLN